MGASPVVEFDRAAERDAGDLWAIFESKPLNA